jgi:polysaccharide biosynthesis/export protein
MNAIETCRALLPHNRTTVASWIAFAFSLLLLVGTPGCSTPQYQDFGDIKPSAPASGSILLKEGDVLRITFPGTPNLNGSPIYTIRRDGRITLPLVGELNAAGKTPVDLQKELVVLYANLLVMKEVNVSVEASSFSVYVTGAVLRPGKVDSNHPMSALEAIMEAGGFDYNKANLKAVTVSRTVGGRVQHYTLNLKSVLAGQTSEVFYLKPSDIVFVPERFVFF